MSDRTVSAAQTAQPVNLDGYDHWDSYVSRGVHAMSDAEFTAMEIAGDSGDLYAEDDND